MANKFSQKLQKADEGKKNLDIGALLEDNGTEDILAKAKEDGRFLSLSPECFIPDPNQPRKTFDDIGLDDLRKSIESRGQLQPILVGKCNGSNQYPIIAGERRWRAISNSEIVSEVLAVIKEDSVDEIEQLLIQIDENNKREEVPAIENAKAMQRIVDLSKAKGHNQEYAAKLLGISKGRLSQSLSLLKAPQLIQGLSLHGETQDVDVLYHLSKASKDKPEEVSELIEDWRSGQVLNMRKATRDLAASSKENKQSDKDKGSQSKPEKKSHNSNTGKVVSSVQVERDGDVYKLTVDQGKKKAVFTLDDDSLSLLKAEIEKNWS